MSSDRPHANCRELLGQLSDYIDGELEATLCSELETHLAGCPNCRIIVDTLRKTIALYQTHAASDLPPDVEQRLYKVLKIER